MMRRRIWRGLGAKLRSRSGFSLSELLVASLILLMATAVAAQSYPVIRGVYVSAMDAANAEALMNTTVVALRNELYLSAKAEIGDDGKSVTYVDSKTGYQCTIMAGDPENGKSIQIEQYQDMELANEEDRPGARSLVSDAASANGMHTTFDSISYAGGVFRISGLRVIREGRAEPVAHLETCVIRTYNP